jgi:hypothetical protein
MPTTLATPKQSRNRNSVEAVNIEIEVFYVSFFEAARRQIQQID